MYVVRPTSTVPTSSFGDMMIYIIVGGGGAGAVVIMLIVTVVVLTVILCRKSKHQCLRIKLRINCKLYMFTNNQSINQSIEFVESAPLV